MDGFKAKRNLAVSMIAAALLAGACGSPSDDGTIRPLPPLDSTTTSEIAETTTTTAPTTTTETTVIEIALADMERPELESPGEWENNLDEIFGRYLLYWEALYNAAGPPFADPAHDPLLELLDSGLLEGNQAQLQELSDADEVIIRTDTSLDDHGLRLPNPSVLEKTEGNRVVIQDCWIRDDIVQTLDGETVTEHFETLLWNVDLIVVDGDWRIFGVTEAGPDSDGYQECQDLFDTLEQ